MYALFYPYLKGFSSLIYEVQTLKLNCESGSPYNDVKLRERSLHRSDGHGPDPEGVLEHAHLRSPRRRSWGYDGW